MPVLAFHSTANDEIRDRIIRDGFLARKDTKTEHFGHGIHFTTTLPRIPGHDFDCFGKNHFLSLLLLKEGITEGNHETETTLDHSMTCNHNLWWSVSSGVATVNDDACMIPLVSFWSVTWMHEKAATTVAKKGDWKTKLNRLLVDARFADVHALRQQADYLDRRGCSGVILAEEGAVRIK
jgi:hypothetical protein